MAGALISIYVSAAVTAVILLLIAWSQGSVEIAVASVIIAMVFASITGVASVLVVERNSSEMSRLNKTLEKLSEAIDQLKANQVLQERRGGLAEKNIERAD